MDVASSLFSYGLCAFALQTPTATTGCRRRTLWDRTAYPFGVRSSSIVLELVKRSNVRSRATCVIPGNLEPTCACLVVDCAPVPSLSALSLVGTRSEEDRLCSPVFELSPSETYSGPAVRPRSNVCLNELFRPFLELFTSLGGDSAWASHTWRDDRFARSCVEQDSVNGWNISRRFLTFRDTRWLLLNELYARPSFDGLRLEQILCRESRPHLRPVHSATPESSFLRWTKVSGLGFLRNRVFTVHKSLNE